MPNLLLHSASVCAPTGFGRVSRAVAEAFLRAGWEVTQVAYDHLRDPLEGFPGLTLVPAQVGASNWGEDTARDLYERGLFDAMLVMADLEIAASWAHPLSRTRDRLLGKPCPIAFYFPVDGPVHGYTEMVALADVAITYTSWGRGLIMEALHEHARGHGVTANVQVVPLGVDPDVFKPLSPRERKQARKEIFHVHDDTFVSLVVARNSPRKDIFQALQAQRLLRESAPRTLMYVHAAANDAGGSLPQQIIGLQLRPKRDSILASPGRLKWPEQNMAALYGAADALVCTARREGWGLPVTEAMACGTTVIAPDYGPFRAQLGDGRGVLVPPACLVWTAGDDRGHGWLSDPGAVADAVLQTAAARATGAHEAMVTSAREWALEHTLAGMGDKIVRAVGGVL